MAQQHCDRTVAPGDTLMRTLAIDLGTRRIGLAQSDEGGGFATPIDVLNVTHPDQAIDPSVKLISREEVNLNEMQD